MTLASAVEYTPFGTSTALTAGNGVEEKRRLGRSGRLTAITAPGRQDQAFGYDAAFNVTSITDALRADRTPRESRA